MNNGTVVVPTGSTQTRSKADSNGGCGPRTIELASQTYRSANVLELRACSYYFAWFGIVALHCVCAAYLTQLARVYSFFMHPYMDYWARLVAHDRHVHFGHVGWLVGAIAALHYWQLLSIVWASLRAHELVLPDGSSAATQFTDQISTKLHANGRHTSRFSTAFLAAQLETLALPSRLVLRIWRVAFSRHGFFGVESDFFPLVFTLREVVEIVSQTFQAHRSSESLPRPWLNSFFVALVVVNCWSTPMLQHALQQHHRGLERVVCLVLDVILNVGSSVLIPVVVFLPYYRTFDPATFLFPIDALYDALFFARLVTENQLLFSLATADVLSRLVPHVAIVSSLTSVATLIRRRGRRSTSRVDAAANTTTAESKHKSKRKSTDHKHNSATTVVASLAKTLAHAASFIVVGSRTERAIAYVARRKRLLVHALFVAWGLAVLLLHVRVMMRLRDPVVGCRQTMGAWFATDYPCSVYVYNCFRHGVVSPDTASWPSLDESTLLYLTLSHCAALTVPSHIQRYPNLLGFQLHNVTLVEWSKASAITAAAHPRLAVVLIALANMTRIPDGLLEPLPATLNDIEITHTNLTALPHDLHTKWHPLATLYVEHSLIATFPETLLSLEVTELSLHGNRIEFVPELHAAHQYFVMLVLSANPLRELPDTLGAGTMLSFLSLENTLVAEMPAWTRTRIEDTAYLFGSPFCATHTDEVDTRIDGVLFACSDRDSRVTGKVPLEIFGPHIPLDQ